tara:strand:+ start:11058 stop:12380 length:1323 start_codon:yes stop_codon:yes gene_type:complete
MVLPLFKSHYSLGRSILTLEKKETQLINGPDSIIDICLDHEIKDFYLVEDSMGSFLQAYSNTKDEDLSFRFGLKINVTKDRHEKNEEALKTSSKYIIFAKNEDGYKRLIKIYSDAASAGFYYVPRTDFSILRELWDDSSLALAIPFYDSFIFKNTLGGGECIPEFDFTDPTFLVEENELFFDSIVRKRIESFCKDKYEMQDAQSIFYKEKEDFTAYLTLRCMNNRSTWNKPNIEHLSSDEFSFESWAEKEGVTFVKSPLHKPKLRMPEEDTEAIEVKEPVNTIVKLTKEEIKQAVHWGNARRDTNVNGELKDRSHAGKPMGGSWRKNDIIATGSEIAFAKFIGEEFTGTVNTFNGADVGEDWQVRCTDVENFSLIIRPQKDKGDKLKEKFVLVIYQRNATFRIAGYQVGENCIKEKYLKNPGGNRNREAYFVPQSDLIKF